MRGWSLARFDTELLLRELIVNPLKKARLLFGLAAFASFVLSVSLWFGGYREQGMFVGLWVPSILGLGALMLAGTGVSRV